MYVQNTLVTFNESLKNVSLQFLNNCLTAPGEAVPWTVCDRTNVFPLIQFFHRNISQIFQFLNLEKIKYIQ